MNYSTSYLPIVWAQSKRNSIIALILLAISLSLVGYLQIRGDRYQRDFTTFYIAAKMHAEGGNPYDLAALRQAAGSDVLPFLYPPLTLPIFRAFTLLPLETVRTLWLWLRVVFLIILFWIWRRHFVRGANVLTFYALALLAFGGAVFLDLKAGNVSIIEQLLLWSGFVFLLKDRLIGFCAFVLCAAVFKGAPLTFILLLPLLGYRHAWWYVFGTATAFGVFQLVNYLAYGSMYIQYLQNAVAWDERGLQTNPSTLALLNDLWDWASSRGLSLNSAHVLSLLSYLVVVIVVLFLSRRVYRTLHNEAGTDNSPVDQKITIIFLSSIVYGLLAPRFKLYSFILVLPAVYYVFRRYATASGSIIWFVLLSLPANPAFPMSASFLQGFWLYYPLLTLYLLWFVWVINNGRIAHHGD